MIKQSFYKIAQVDDNKIIVTLQLATHLGESGYELKDLEVYTKNSKKLSPISEEITPDKIISTYFDSGQSHYAFWKTVMKT